MKSASASTTGVWVLCPVASPKSPCRQDIELIAVKWNQYTPYFNDGETCDFRVNEAGFKFSDTSESAGDYEDGFIQSWDLKEKIDGAYDYPTEAAKKKAAVMDEINSFISAIPENFMEIAFGDHMTVTVTAESIEVEEYDHD